MRNTPAFRAFMMLLVGSVLLMLHSTVIAQILNPGFELWTAGEPDEWTSSNSAPQVVNIKSSTDAHSGNFSMRGEVVSFSNSIFAPQLQNRAGGRKGSAVDRRVSALTGWLKFHSESADVIQISVLAAQGNFSIGSGSLLSSTEAADWVRFEVPISYTFTTTPLIPDTVIIFCSIKGDQSTTPHVGTWFELDDLGLSDPISAVSPSSATDVKVAVWPNPVSAVGHVRLVLPDPSPVSAELVDVTGRVVHIISNTPLLAGTSELRFDTTPLAEGTYVLRMDVGASTLSHMLIVRH